MAVRLGIPSALAGASLPRRLAWLIGARLLLLLGMLALMGLFYVRSAPSIDAFTPRTGLLLVIGSFGLAGIYAALLKSGKLIERLPDIQVILDQITWTVVVYLTGGVSSGATSFYGLTCLVGAILTGLRGAALAAVTGAVCYGGLVVGLSVKWLSPPPDQPSAAPLYELGGQETLYYVVVNVLVMIVVTLLAGYLAERLRITGGQLEQAEERAQQAERMAALGRLAAGLAHEIRNPLGSIAGSIRLLQLGTGLSEEDRQLCDIIRREAARLNDLVGDMMDLSRPRKPDIVHIDVARVAREVAELMGKSGRGVSDVTVAYRGIEAATVRADAAQFRQLVWNLARNAVQASSAGDDVTIDVSRQSDSVELAVIDHGVGIDDQAKERLFDAFFTTRSKGTGVGLAVVKRIVDDHGFTIEVDSAAGGGAVFRVRMPTEPDPLATSPEA